MSMSEIGYLCDGEGARLCGGGRAIERYSLEHVEGICNESQRADRVACLRRTDISCQ